MSRRLRTQSRASVRAPRGSWSSRRRSGFGRLHVSRSVTAYLKRYGDVGVDLRLSDRMINLVEDGVDLAVRIGHLPDSTLVARHVGEMRRIVVASSGYLKRARRAQAAAGNLRA